ncbi:T9SS type A sorting domain-containing protein [Marixanthomonas ophiurae]|uniref:T9SS C-terminal target domain-containing protein n=1 Tax=Marixanthomonas ophiurae TaxID=387659 RepID=A0A3E1QCU0_9FLAO|nr:T9SS type A sorting domain-containing protein [Marixanthomonas ophiurae]RFN59971.1 T9SS C-terminal target domain-containing protein [Marixanthomonas ophiurae]
MKKIYLLGFTLCAFAFTGMAQVEQTDDFDSYDIGDISPQSDAWRTWSGAEGGAEEAQVSFDQATSGFQSLEINEVGAPAGIDMLYLIDSEPDSGIYTIQWNMYIPTGNEGYFNAQSGITEPQDPNTLFGGNVYFNEAGAAPGEGSVDGNPGGTFSFNHDVWFNVRCVYDIDNQLWDMFIDGTEVITDQQFAFNTPFTYLGAIDFYAPSEFTLFYIDDIVAGAGVLSTNDFSEAAFNVYPNPVKDVLNIESAAAVNNVTVYDVLGKTVLTAKPDAISPSIDMSALSSGAYLVQVTIDGASKTVKVIK